MNREGYMVNRESSAKKKKQEEVKNEGLNIKEEFYEVSDAQYEEVSNDQSSPEKIVNKEVIKNGRLQEIRFWITIMKEHALFIRVSLPCDRTSLIEEAQYFFELFKGLEERVQRAAIIDYSCRLSSKIDPFFALNFDPPGIV